MCEPVSIGMAVVAVAGAAMGARQQAKAEGAAEDARRSNQHEQIAAMHRADADMRLETVDKFEEARQKLTETNMQAVRNRGTVNAAIGESGMEGATMDRVRRSVENEASAEKMAILDNYDRDYSVIFANRVANVENTKAALRGSKPAIRTSKLAQALGVASAGMQGYAAGKSMSNAESAAPKGGK